MMSWSALCCVSIRAIVERSSARARTRVSSSRLKVALTVSNDSAFRRAVELDERQHCWAVAVACWAIDIAWLAVEFAWMAVELARSAAEFAMSAAVYAPTTVTDT